MAVRLEMLGGNGVTGEWTGAASSPDQFPVTLISSLQRFAKIAPMPPSDIDELFAQTLRGAYEDDQSKVVASDRPRQVFQTAVTWVVSPKPIVRAKGLDVLPQLGKTAQH